MDPRAPITTGPISIENLEYGQFLEGLSALYRDPESILLTLGPLWGEPTVTRLPDGRTEYTWGTTRKDQEDGAT